MARQMGAGLPEMLTVIQHQQQGFMPEEFTQRVQDILPRLFAQPQNRRQCMRHVLLAGKRCQFYKYYAMNRDVFKSGCQFYGQPGLPDSACARQRDQPLEAKTGLDLLKLLLPSKQLSDR